MAQEEKTFEEMSTAELYVKLSDINRWMTKAKATTETLRRTIKARLEADMIIATGKEGAQTVDYSVNGVPGKLKVEQKVNRTLNQKLVAGVMKQLPVATRAKVFKTKYELSLTGYRTLNPEQLALVEPIIKVSAGIPSITFTPAVADDEEV